MAGCPSQNTEQGRDLEMRKHPPPYRILLLLALCLICFGKADIANAQSNQSRLEFEELVGEISENTSIDDICCGQERGNWRTSKKVQTSYSQPVKWLRLPTLPAGTVLEFPQVADEIILYERGADDELWSQEVSGDTVALSDRSMQTAELAFRLKQGEAETTQRFIRIRQPSNVTYTVEAWSVDAFQQSVRQRFNMRLILFGFCGAMIFFNLIVSLITREKVFAFNALTVCAIVVLAAYTSGQGGAWLWPEAPAWSNRSLLIGLSGVCLFSPLFVSTYLQDSSLNKQLLRVNCWVGAMLASAPIFALGSDWTGFHAIMLVSAPLVAIAQACLVITSCIKGDRTSLPFLIPLTIMLVGTAFTLLRNMVAMDFGWANYHLLEIALALEAITFSLILASRLRFYAGKAVEAEQKIDRLQLETAQQLSDFQDQERSRIARDLHDSIGHGLAIAVGQLEKADKEKGLSQELSQRLNHIRFTVKEAISETRRISHALHPARLDHLEFKKVLQSMFDDLSSSHSIDCSVELDCPENLLTREEKTQVSRIVQEAVSNVAKHSRATHCYFQLCHTDRLVTIMIVDDGIGSSSGENDDTEGHLGLASMKHRVARLRGDLTLTSSDAGFCIEFSFVPQKRGGS